ncbi:MAG: O-antigen ligase family protein [Flavobacteriales bacterium]|nr:O-antigen ligase family protein [Flavobacteriales bacterium]
MEEGIKNLQKSLPFLVFPLIIFTTQINKNVTSFLLKYFSYSVVIASLLAIAKALYLKANNLGSYFHFSKLEPLFDKHNTYFALFSLIAIVYFLFNISRKKWWYVLAIIYLFGPLYLLSVRISIIGLVIILSLYLLSKRKTIPANYFYILLLTALVPILFYFTPSFQDKFNPHTPEGVAISDVGSRKIHWQAVVNTIGQDNILTGAGTGDGHNKLFNTYKEFNFETGYIYNYNAHNQYLEIVLFYGIIGLLLLVFQYLTLIKINLNKNNFSALAIIFLFLTFMITESILQRHDGIVVFAFFMTLFALKENQQN